MKAKNHYRTLIASLVGTAAVIFSMTITSEICAQRIGGIDPFGYSQKLFDDKMYEIAAATLKQFIQDNPTDGRCAEAQYKIGEAYLLMGEYKRAYEEFRTFTTRYYSAPNLIEGFLRQGECLERLGENENAAEAYFWGAKNFFREQDAAITFYLKAGELYFRIQNLEKAEITFKEMTKLYPGSEGEYRANYYLAVIVWEKHQSRQALRMLEQVAERAKNVEIKFLAAMKAGDYFNILNDLPSAALSYENAAQYAAGDSPKQAEAMYRLGLTKIQQGRGGEAVSYLENASKLPGLPDSLAQRLLVATGEGYVAAGDPVRAQEQLKSIEKTISIPSVRLLYYAALGEAARGTGNFAGALSYYDQMMRGATDQEFPPMEKLNEVLGKVIALYTSQGSLLSAAQYADKILIQSLKEQDAAAYLRVGGLYEKAGAFGPAAHVYETGSYKFPASQFSDELLFSLGRCQEKQGMFPQALSTYRRILSEFPGTDNDAEIRTKVEILDKFFVRTGSASPDGSKLSIFVSLLNDAGGANSLSAEQMLSIGRSYARQDRDYEMALAFYQKARSLTGGTDGVLSFLMGQAYDRLSEWSRYNGNIPVADEYGNEAITFYESAITSRIQQPDLDEAKMRFVELTIERAGGMERAAAQAQTYYNELAQNGAFTFRDKAAYYAALASCNLPSLSFDESLLYIENFLKDFPGSPYRENLIYRAAEEFYFMNRMVDALKYYDDYLREFPRGRFVPRALFLSANCYRNNDDITSAIHTLKRLSNEFNYSVYADSAAEKLGDIYRQQQRTDLALREYDGLLESYKKRPDWQPTALDSRAESLAGKILDVYREKRDPGGAIFFLKDLLFYEPTGAAAEKLYYRLAQLYRGIGERRQAVDAYLTVENYNYSAGQYTFLSFIEAADLLTELQDFNRSVEVIEKARQLALSDEEKARLIVMEGTVMLRAGKLAQGQAALSEFERNYRSISGYDNFRAQLSFELGKYYFSQKDYAEAENILKDTYSRWEQTEFAPKAALYIGMSYRNTAKINEALEVLHGLARKYPDNPFSAEVYMAIGQLSFQIERYPAAAASFKRAIEVAEAPDPTALRNLIMSYQFMQMYDVEIKYRRDFIEQFPSDSGAVDQKFQIGVALKNAGAFKQAIDHFQNLLPEADINMETEIAFQVGECYRSLGMKELAIGEFLKVVNYDKSVGPWAWKTTALYFVGELYGELGYDNKAIDYFKQIIAREGLGSNFGQQAQTAIEKIEQKVY